MRLAAFSRSLINDSALSVVDGSAHVDGDREETPALRRELRAETGILRDVGDAATSPTHIYKSDVNPQQG